MTYRVLLTLIIAVLYLDGNKISVVTKTATV